MADVYSQEKKFQFARCKWFSTGSFWWYSISQRNALPFKSSMSSKLVRHARDSSYLSDRCFHIVVFRSRRLQLCAPVRGSTAHWSQNVSNELNSAEHVTNDVIENEVIRRHQARRNRFQQRLRLRSSEGQVSTWWVTGVSVSVAKVINSVFEQFEKRTTSLKKSLKILAKSLKI